ncbi:unnamed protein product [Peniophora sp. CBMAI 1063]|nr:unnamed protein product [Peniophora sp. CBMAI 1063]
MFDTPARPLSPAANARIRQYTDELIAHTMRQWAVVEAQLAAQNRPGSASPPGSPLARFGVLGHRKHALILVYFRLALVYYSSSVHTRLSLCLGSIARTSGSALSAT